MFYRQNETQESNGTDALQTVKIRLTNASPNTPSVDVYVNNVLVESNLKYMAFTEYLPAKPGLYVIRIVPSELNSVIAVEEQIELIENSIYTMAVTGVSTDLAVTLIYDKSHKGEKSKAYMRFINLSPYDTSFNILMNGKTAISNLEYIETSQYFEFAPGSYKMEVVNSKSGETVMIHPNTKLSGGKFFATYVEGVVPQVKVVIPLEGATYL